MEYYKVKECISEISKTSQSDNDLVKYHPNSSLCKQLKELVCSIEPTKENMERLWKDDSNDAKLLSIFLCEKNENCLEIAKAWVYEVRSWYVCDFLSNIFINSGEAVVPHIKEYLSDDKETVRRIGYNYILYFAKKNKDMYKFLSLCSKWEEGMNQNKFESIVTHTANQGIEENSKVLNWLESFHECNGFKKVRDKALYERVLLLLKSKANTDTRQNMERIGINTKQCLGVTLTSMREVAAEFKNHHSLASILRKSKIHEMQILATMIDDPKKVTKKQIIKMTTYFDSWDITDLTCRNLIEKTKFAKQMIDIWCYHEEEFIKRAGFVLIARMAVLKKIDVKERKKYLEMIQYGSLDERNYVKKAVNWALRQIGKMDLESFYEALNICFKIKAYHSQSAKWITQNALFEFKNLKKINKSEENPMKLLNFLEERDPICLSHYPPLYKTRTYEEVVEGIALSEKNELNFKNGTIYVHIPFCDEICQFCPFNKFLKQEDKVISYLEALYSEIDFYAGQQYIQDTEFESVAFGGGTPSCLETEQLTDLINKIKESFHFKREIEIAIEGNPENYTYEKMEATFAVGVNRISLGIQTFNPDREAILKLHHTIPQGIRAIENAHALGCNNVGIDLIYNIPGQTDEELTSDVKTAIDLQVEHVTLFAITTPPNTKLRKNIDAGQIEDVGSKEREIELYKLAEKLLICAGYEQYSVYDFILPNKVNHHALNYFSRQSELLGLGAASFGYVNGYMYINSGNLKEYEKTLSEGRLPILYGEKATEKDKMYGTVAKGLRLLRVSKIKFYDRFGQHLEDVFKDEIAFLKMQGLIDIDEYNIYLTQLGILYGNNVCKAFISSDRKEAAMFFRNALTKGVRKQEFKGAVS